MTAAATTGTSPNATEFITCLKESKTQLRKFNDDQARPFNTLAVKNLRCVVPPDFEAAGFEAMNATFMVGTGSSGVDAGSKDNVFKGMAEVDVLDYLSDTDTMYINALGAERKPFIYQERTPLEVIILDSPDDVAYHNAVLVLCRQRFVMTYGDPRRSIEYIYT